MSAVSYYKNLSLSKKIYISTCIGLFLGMFFGDRCDILQPFNTLFIKIFQIAIIPYMIFTIIQSIGSMTTANAKLIGKRGGVILVALWAISIFFAFGLQYSFPDISRAKFFRSLDIPKSTDGTLFDLFIPSNPFYAVSHGLVPAIVIFCILVGMALIHEKRKDIVVQFAEVFASIMKRVNDYIMLLLPLGVLIMSTYTFGTLSFVKLKGVLLYIIASIFYIIFISMFVYPGILSSLSKISYRKFLHYTIPAALIAFTTGSVFLALPVIYNLMHKFNEEERSLHDHGIINTENGRHLISILVPLAWIVPASYKFLIIFFIVFEQWYYNCSVNFFEKVMYYICGIPCLFGNNSVTVPFLLEITNLPAEAYNIFMMVSNFMVYFNNANGAIFIVVSTILCYLSITGSLKLNLSKLIFIFASSIIFFSVVVTEVSFVMDKFLSGDEEAKKELSNMVTRARMDNWFFKINAEYLKLSEYHHIPSLNSSESLLDKIDRTDILQVGYNPDSAPLCFFNAKNELVGYDIDFIYLIAQELGCTKIEFYPIDSATVYQNCLDKGIQIAICVGGYTYRSASGSSVVASDPYLRTTPAVIIPNKYKNSYPDYESVDNDASGLTIGILYKTILSLKSKELSEDIKANNVVLLESIDDYYINKKCDALFIWGELGAAINIVHPGYQIYYPTKNLEDLEYFDLFLSYLLPYDDNSTTFRDCVNSWITAWYRYGIQKERYKYWILGKTGIKTSEPWSILDWLMEHNYFLINLQPDLLL
ncbi:MAG TPA: hypothetical protein DD381_08035 [Lentisphaeria bacterium]|nr:MAG: hypothetical protein A2X47_04600 [Lentisphaerae bacterium GWF2_38_69]HBM16271.1 hypothetical protein [Lentisphaeria bacterium]